MKLLFVASDPMELLGLLRHCRMPRDVRVPVDWSRRAQLGAYEVLLAANGVGAVRAAAAVDAVVPIFHPDAICSVGFCGALVPHLKIASIIVADQLHIEKDNRLASGTDDRFVSSVIPESNPEAVGPILSLDHVVQTAAEKSKLSRSGAVAVEMEAAGVASRAAALGLPLYCIKAVTDLASEDLSIDFNSLLRPDGHFDKIGVFKSSLRQPLKCIPELLRLRKRCVQAREALGDFIAGCCF